jgi:NAD(P)-dependent dehydrogenase (short-subunit alcohol dehydrogenase family)
MSGAKVTTFAVDLRDPAGVEQMIEVTWQKRPLDLLVNNAAAFMVSRTETLSPRAIDAVLNTTLHGTFYCTVAVGKRWIAAGRGGTVLNVVATPAFTGSPLAVASAAAKAGVLAMTRSLAVEWGPKAIRLNAIAPGVFPTPGTADRGSDPQKEAAWVPLGRVGEHAEFANLMAFLAADGSAYINGELIVIDGGRWMQGTGGPVLREAQAWTDEQWAALRKG